MFYVNFNSLEVFHRHFRRFLKTVNSKMIRIARILSKIVLNLFRHQQALTYILYRYVRSIFALCICNLCYTSILVQHFTCMYMTMVVVCENKV